MDDWDGASTLISDLLEKLSELDDKVATYRKDMATEFQRYSDDLLRNLPEEVTTEVNRAIAASVYEGRYRSLYPRALGEESPIYLPPESPAIDRHMWDGRGSPPPVLHHTSGVPNAPTTCGSTIPRALGSSPRDGLREKEFRGLFTPSYLPLLEADSRTTPVQPPPQSPPPTVVACCLDSLPRAAKEKEPSNVAVGGGGGGVVPRFPPVRSFTDPSADCGSSESDRNGNVRRSALRRSSSSNRGSPRRVRFDFEGEVVLPTSPPRSRDVALSSPPPAVGTKHLSVSSDDSPGAAKTVAPPQSSASRSLLDDEDDDYLPPPKKVSSSQALRALSKLPLEDPSTWTVVNANSDPSPDAVEGAAAQPSTTLTCVAANNSATYMPSPAAEIEEVEPQYLGASQLGSPLQDLEEYDDDSSASDNDFISMPIRPIRKKSNSPDSRMPTSKLPEAQSASTRSPATAVDEATIPNSLDKDIQSQHMTASQSNRKPRAPPVKVAAKAETRAAEDDGDELFDMEDDIYTKRDSRPYIEHGDDSASEAEVEAETEGVAVPERGGIPMEKPPLSPSLPIPPKPQGASATPPKISAGSYRGRPVSFDVVKDPKLLQRAAELGDMHTFVGSIDGRSGVDGIDPSCCRGAASFRGGSSLSGLAFSGAPRSFSERVFLEDLAEEGGSLPKRK